MQAELTRNLSPSTDSCCPHNCKMVISRRGKSENGCEMHKNKAGTERAKRAKQLFFIV